MQDVTPTASLSIAIALLSRAVARSATFQLAAGVESILEAEARVEFCEVRFENEHFDRDRRPFAVLSPLDHAYNLDAGGAYNYLRPRGVLGLYLAKDVPESMQGDTPRDLRNRTFDALNFHAGVQGDVAALAAAEADAAGPTIEEDGLALAELGITSIPLRTWGFVPELQRPTLGFWSWSMFDVHYGDDL